MKRVKVSAIIVAAGEGQRFGSSKQFAQLRGKTVLDRCLEEFETHRDVDEIVLVLPDEGDKDRLSGSYKKVTAVVRGGTKRQDSVFQGFKKLDGQMTLIVLVHDGVRPLVGKNLISRVIDAAREKGAAVPVIPLEDTVKEAVGGEVVRTLDRSVLFRVQTPQGYIYSVLREALEKAVDEEFYGTDEAQLVERCGRKVHVVRGDPRNIKITTPEDLKVVEAFLEA